ncbi:MAG: cytochrome c4 [Betaproteobacteria bacterium]|nr:cytochrome c4 [Betaproteobacteria bacterium]MBM3384094.1 cytochrome c4 [Betaproteobacteria bacterium]
MARSIVVAFAASLVSIAGSAWAQGPAKLPAGPDLAKGQQIASQACAACHAADGNSPAAANPKLAGQIPEYLHRQLMNFKPQGAKKAERENAVMAGMVAALSADDMRNVAAYYASQKLKPAAAKDKALAALGQKLYRGGNPSAGLPACAGCHGPAGAGVPAQYPRIAGQFAEYIDAQLKAFRSGARANDPNGMMRGVAAKMSEREIQAVAEYAAGLR